MDADKGDSYLTRRTRMRPRRLNLVRKVSDELSDRPSDSSAPRLMTARHPRAVGTFGPSVQEWSLNRPGMHMRPLTDWRWWQQLALNRAFEHDERGQLVWQTVLLSAPRQTGKSYLERAVLGWRIHQAEAFGGAQDVLHVAHKLVAAQEVWRPAARWAIGEYGRPAVRWANGEQQIELPDGSRWMIQAATDGAGVAFSLSMVLVDEAWRVARHVVDAALSPTMAETEQPQLWLVSTAGTSQSDLMMAYRSLALAMERPADGDSLLMLEWSAPPDPDLDIDSVDVWRDASPFWDARREARLRKARAEVTEVEFRQQWLNQWVPTVAAPVFEPSIWPRMEWLGAMPAGRLAFGFDLAADRSHASVLAVCNGVAEVIDHRAGASWLPVRLAELAARWSPIAIGCDGSGPAASVADQLTDTDAGRLLTMLNGKQLAIACGQLFDAITDGQLAARPNEHLERAVLHAQRRPYGQSWVFARSNGDASCVPLLALVTAVWAAEHSAEVVEASQIW